MNGCLTGLVAITAGCATVETWAAVIIGFFAGLFYLLGSFALVRLRIDDAVDALMAAMQFRPSPTSTSASGEISP